MLIFRRRGGGCGRCRESPVETGDCRVEALEAESGRQRHNDVELVRYRREGGGAAVAVNLPVETGDFRLETLEANSGR